MTKIKEVYWHGHCRLAIVNGKTIVQWLTVFAIALLIGCGSPQVTAYKAEGVVITTVDSALKAYADYSQAHPVSQNDMAKLTDAHMKYYEAQQAAKFALEVYTASKTEGNAAALQTASDNAAEAAAAVIAIVKGFLK